jgi:hypothetical protein
MTKSKRGDKWITVAILKTTRKIIKAIQDQESKESPIDSYEELGELVDRVVRADAVAKGVKIQK